MAFPEGSKFEWTKNKLISAIVEEYATSEELIGFINEEMSASIRTTMRDAFKVEAENHNDLKQDFNDLRSDISED